MRWCFRVLQLLITNFKGVYHLVDMSDRLPEMIRAPGLSRWKVTAEKDINMQSSYEEYLSTLSEQQKAASKVVSTMFPPANEQALHLERWSVNVDYGSSANITNEVIPTVGEFILINKILAVFSSQYWNALQSPRHRGQSVPKKLRKKIDRSKG